MKNRISINRKSAIKIMACNLMLSVVFSSCVNSGEIDNSKGDKVSLIEPHNEVMCRYTTRGSSTTGNLLLHKIMFIDSCGKYKIGDVVCVGRKNY